MFTYYLFYTEKIKKKNKRSFLMQYSRLANSDHNHNIHCGGLSNGPNNVQNLMPRPADMLPYKKGFTNVTKLRTLK